jgi:DNA-directed RNA polymerase specialized sigma24 family protein
MVYTEATDQALVDLALQGDDQAFTELYNRHHRKIRGFFHCHGWSDEDSEDLTQETFIKAFRGLRTYDGRPLTGWLYGIAKHEAATRFKKQARQNAICGAPMPVEVLDRTWDQEKLLARRELVEVLRRSGETWARRHMPEYADLIVDVLRAIPKDVLCARHSQYSNPESLRRSLPGLMTRVLSRSPEAFEEARAWVEARWLLGPPEDPRKPHKFLGRVDLDKVESADIA